MAKFANLDEGERERLEILAEECAEVIQAVTKILRHGKVSYHPADPNTSNKRMLEKEIGHVYHAVDRLMMYKEVDTVQIVLEQGNKAHSIKQWLHHG